MFADLQSFGFGTGNIFLSVTLNIIHLNFTYLDLTTTAENSNSFIWMVELLKMVLNIGYPLGQGHISRQGGGLLSTRYSSKSDLDCECKVVFF